MSNDHLLNECFQAFVNHDYERCIRQGLPLMEVDAPPEIVQVVLISLHRIGQSEVLANIGSQALRLTERHPWFHSLIELTLGLTSLDPLLVRAETDDQRCQALFYAAERLVSTGEKDKARELLKACVDLSANCAEKTLALAELVQLEEGLKSPAEKQLDELNQRFLQLFQEQKFVEASGVIAQATELASNILGTNHVFYATLLNNLAMTHCVLGRHLEALSECRTALEIRRRLLGETHEKYGESLNNLGEVYRVLGDHSQSLQTITEALRVRREILGAKHPDYASTLMNLAALHMGTGDVDRAVSLFEQVCAILLEALGDQSPSYAVALGNLAGAYVVVGRPAEAVPLFRQAAQVNRASYGEISAIYAQSLSNLAAACQKSGNPAEARVLLERARDIIGQAVGKLHPSYAQCIKNIDLFENEIGVAKG